MQFNPSINEAGSRVSEGLYLDTEIQQPLLTEHQSFNKKFITNVKEYIAFGDLDFFTKESNNNAGEFFKQIMYQINLSDLYEIVDTCYYAQAMPYCPILVHCKQTERYLLQVWNKSGDMVYEKILTQRPTAWCVTHQILVFKPHEADQSAKEDCYNIVYLYRDNKTVRVNVKGIPGVGSIQTPIIGFCNKCLYISGREEPELEPLL